MPTKEQSPTGTSVVAAGWTDPTNAYVFDGAQTVATADNAEQEYTGLGITLGGNETIDKVFVKIKYRTTIATLIQGDAATFEGYIKVYDGSAWNTITVITTVYSCTTANDETLSFLGGDITNDPTVYIDVTSYLDTKAKLASAVLRLLFNITATAAGETLAWRVDGIALLVCYSTGSAGSLAVTKYTYPQKAKTAINAVEKALETLAET